MPAVMQAHLTHLKTCVYMFPPEVMAIQYFYFYTMKREDNSTELESFKVTSYTTSRCTGKQTVCIKRKYACRKFAKNHKAVSRVCLDLLSNMMSCLSSNKITGSTSKVQQKSKSGVQNIAKKRKQRCMHEGISVMHVLYSMKISIMDRISK
jgi:D-alanyl-D-alanine dipeptidase